MLFISRPDISPDTLTDYPQSSRFIKLPIKPYLKLLPAKDPDTGGVSNAWEQLNRPQTALINALNNPAYRFICAALSRRLGKTYICNIVAQLVVLVPGSNVLIISPNYSLSSISFELQRSLIKQFNIEVTRDNLKDKVIELSNGSTVRMGSVGTVDSVLGRSYDLILFDEAAISEHGEDAFNVQLRPTLDKPGAKAVFISTPRGKKNWFSKFFERGLTDDYPEWCSLQADYTENHRMSEKDVAEARKSMSKGEFEQEYMASFTSFQGQIYNFKSDEHILDYESEDGAEPLAGLDPGYKDPTAFVVLLYHPNTELYWIVDEYQQEGLTTAIHVEYIRPLIEKWGVDTIFVDSAAAQFSADLAYEYDIATAKAKKDVLPGIAKVQNIIEQGKLRVAPHCVHTLACLDQYRWDTKDTLQKERPVHDVHSHMADAIRYAIYSFVT